MKIRIAEEHDNYDWKEYYEKYDKCFIKWIPKEELPMYEEAIKTIGKGTVFIHTYPKLPDEYALLYASTPLEKFEL